MRHLRIQESSRTLRLFGHDFCCSRLPPLEEREVGILISSYFVDKRCWDFSVVANYRGNFEDQKNRQCPHYLMDKRDIDLSHMGERLHWNIKDEIEEPRVILFMCGIYMTCMGMCGLRPIGAYGYVFNEVLPVNTVLDGWLTNKLPIY